MEIGINLEQATVPEVEPEWRAGSVHQVRRAEGHFHECGRAGMDWRLPKLAHPVGQGMVGQLVPATVGAAGKTARGQRSDMCLLKAHPGLGNGRRRAPPQNLWVSE